jgi:hypothetical protein
MALANQPAVQPPILTERTRPWQSLALWAGIATWAAIWGVAQDNPSGLSWHFFVSGTQMLFHGSGLNLYAQHPELQIGAFALVIAAPLTMLGSAGQPVAQLLMTAAGPLCLAAIAQLVAPPNRRLRVLLAGLALMPAWAVLSVRFGHFDDVLALGLAVAALRAVAARRAGLAGLALGAAIAAKPWAIGFAPLLLVLDQQLLIAVGGAVACVASSWAPFVMANPATLSALRPPLGVAESSGLRALGYTGNVVPAWDRVGQFFLEPLCALAPVFRGRWPGLFLVAVAVRLALDPKDNPYYIGGAVLAAVIFDLLATRWIVPWATLLTLVALWQPWAIDYQNRLTTSTGLSLWWFQNPGLVAWIHLAWSAAMIALVMFVPIRGEPPRVVEP